MNRHACAMCLGLMIIAALYTGCATLPGAQDGDFNATAVGKAVTPLVAQLYLNQKALHAVYLDLRSLARGAGFAGGDAILNHLQKACLYVDKAQRSAHHQWDMLSLLDAIRSEHARDFFTRRIDGLEAAVFESNYDLAFLGTYQAFIDLPAAQGDIERALALIRDNQALYTALIEHLAPLAHPRGAPRRT